jgi:hypothetical protein
MNDGIGVFDGSNIAGFGRGVCTQTFLHVVAMRMTAVQSMAVLMNVVMFVLVVVIVVASSV